MARVQIDDLEQREEISREEMMKALGGLRSRSFPKDPGGGPPPPGNRGFGNLGPQPQPRPDLGPDIGGRQDTPCSTVASSDSLAPQRGMR